MLINVVQFKMSVLLIYTVYHFFWIIQYKLKYLDKRVAIMNVI